MYGIRVRKTSQDPWQRVRTKTNGKGLWGTKALATAQLVKLRAQGWRGHVFVTNVPAPIPPVTKVRRPPVHHDGTKAGATHGPSDPRRIILHDTESHDTAGLQDVKNVLHYLTTTDDRLNAHLVIDAEGNTGQGAAFDRMCFHCRGANVDSIGIEMIGFASFSLLKWRSRPEQLEVVARWLAYLSAEYGIPLVHDVDHGVAMHRDVPAGGHHDPGVSFPFNSVLKRAQELKRTGW